MQHLYYCRTSLSVGHTPLEQQFLLRDYCSLFSISSASHFADILLLIINWEQRCMRKYEKRNLLDRETRLSQSVLLPRFKAFLLFCISTSQYNSCKQQLVQACISSTGTFFILLTFPTVIASHCAVQTCLALYHNGSPDEMQAHLQLKEHTWSVWCFGHHLPPSLFMQPYGSFLVP